MDGVNNAFCMSKEEYELARLATKCAGLQGKIDDQAAEIAKYKALCDQMGEALHFSHGQTKEWCEELTGERYNSPIIKGALEAWRAMK